MVSQPHPHAGFISRFLAFVIDLVIINVVSIVIIASTGLILGFFGLDNTLGPVKAVVDFLITTLENAALVITLSFSTIFGLLYLLFFWVLVGFTPGKAIFGLRIVRPNGQRLTLGRAVLRLVGYWLSAMLIFLGFILIIFDNRRQGLHDKIADTIVIYGWKLQNSD